MGDVSSVRVLSHLASQSGEPELREKDVLDLRISGSARDLRSPAARLLDAPLHLLEQLPAIVWTVDRELRISSVLGAGVATIGLSPEHLPGTSLFDQYGTHDLNWPPIRAHLLALAGESVSFEKEWQGRLFQSRVEPLRDGREPDRRLCRDGSFDITERKQAEEALHREKERAQVTLASIGDGVIRADAEGQIDYLNPVAERLTGWTSERAVGQPVIEVFRVVDEVTRAAGRRPAAALPGGGAGRRVARPRRCCSAPTARSTRSATRPRPIRDRNGNLSGAVVVFKDVTQLRGMEREMIYLASHDALTGLINRREFEIAAEAGHPHAPAPSSATTSCSTSTSTSSRSSTTPAATWSATRCSSRSPPCCARGCGAATSWRGWAATSSASSWRTARSTRRGRSPRRCAAPCASSASAGRTRSSRSG